MFIPPITQSTSTSDVFGKSSPNGGLTSYGVYNSFSGADIVAYIHLPSQSAATGSNGVAQQSTPYVGILGNIQTISYSTFREVNAVRSLGNIGVDSYTRGPRTIAGTIIWTVLDQYVLAQALTQAGYDSLDNSGSILVDQIPPFYITITMSNEYGDVSSMALYGVRMVNEGSTYSIDDLITEQTNTYVATDMDPLHKGTPFSNPASSPAAMTGTSVLASMSQIPIINGRG